MKHIFFVFLIVLNSAFTASSEEAPVEAWFKALRTVDRDTFERIIADDARIILKERQVIQSKEEFIASLDSWEIKANNLDLSFDADRKGTNEIIARVCYQFSSNAFANIETFTIQDGKIIQQVQEKLKDGC